MPRQMRFISLTPCIFQPLAHFTVDSSYPELKLMGLN